MIAAPFALEPAKPPDLNMTGESACGTGYDDCGEDTCLNNQIS